MDSLAYATLYRAETTELEARLAERRLADQVRAERRDQAGTASHPAARPRRRLADLFHGPRRTVRLA
ncbi:MAG: hypothetical protein FWF90_02085 [Promicromonosporaceae bacterium]|nr:hypothetical protein [Promicromonosporaceae bacterium]